MMNNNTALLISVVVGIVLSILSNWLYDLLKNNKLLPDKGNIKMMVALVFAFAPLVAFLTMSPAASASDTTEIDNGSVMVGDENSGTVINNSGGDVIVNEIAVSPTPAVYEVWEVSDRVTTNICVQKGDVVSVSAKDGISVGAFLGWVEPDGIDSGLGGASLDEYDIYPEFSHGALLCKLDTEERWMECGTALEFQAQFDGCIQFDVNDNEKENNSGSFEVSVVVFEQ
jgi:hypothetical protein